MSVRRIVRFVGTLLALFGVVALVGAFVTWKWGDPATGLYTRWQQRALADDYRALEARYRPPAPSARGAGTPAPQQDAEQAIRVAAKALRRSAKRGQPIARLDVPRLGLDMVVVNGTDSDTLKKGPGRDPRTAMPGEGELVYVAGHRTTFGAPFAHIDRLVRGDAVVLDLPYARVEYRVTGHVIVPADEISRLESRGREEIALQACHPRFSANQRYIVYARPVRMTPATG